MLQLQKCFSWNAEMLVTDCAVGVQTIQAKPTVLNLSAIFVYFVLAQRFSNRPSRNQIFCRCSRHDDVEIEDGLTANMHGKYWAGNYGGPDFRLPGKRVLKTLMNLPFLLLVSADIDWRQHSGKELSAEIFLWWWGIFFQLWHVMAWFPPNLEINSKTSNSWSVFLGKFAEVSDPTVGVDFFARLLIAH